MDRDEGAELTCPVPIFSVVYDRNDPVSMKGNNLAAHHQLTIP